MGADGDRHVTLIGLEITDDVAQVLKIRGEGP